MGDHVKAFKAHKFYVVFLALSSPGGRNVGACKCDIKFHLMMCFSARIRSMRLHAV